MQNLEIARYDLKKKLGIKYMKLKLLFVIFILNSGIKSSSEAASSSQQQLSPRSTSSTESINPQAPEEESFKAIALRKSRDIFQQIIKKMSSNKRLLKSNKNETNKIFDEAYLNIERIHNLRNLSNYSEIVNEIAKRISPFFSKKEPLSERDLQMLSQATINILNEKMELDEASKNILENYVKYLKNKYIEEIESDEKDEDSIFAKINLAIRANEPLEKIIELFLNKISSSINNLSIDINPAIAKELEYKIGLSQDASIKLTEELMEYKYIDLNKVEATIKEFKKAFGLIPNDIEFSTYKNDNSYFMGLRSDKYVLILEFNKENKLEKIYQYNEDKQIDNPEKIKLGQLKYLLFGDAEDIFKHGEVKSTKDITINVRKKPTFKAKIDTNQITIQNEGEYLKYIKEDFEPIKIDWR